MVNKVTLIGRLGVDPEVRTIQDNAKVANFRIATSESFNNRNGERQERTEWHSIVAWRNWADIAEKYLRKGSLVYIEGKLRTRSWEDNGQKRYKTEIEVDYFRMLDGRRDRDDSGSDSYDQAPASRSSAPVAEAAGNEQEDDLPF